MKGIGCLSLMVRLQNDMNKVFVGTIMLTALFVFPGPTMAGVDIGVSISLPLPIVFVAPPEMVVIPETYVYVVPDVEEEIFFYNGWWWRPWEGRWYRSRHYDAGWVSYRQVPSFYGRIPSSWRSDYREHRWGDRQWDHQRIPHEQVKQNWNKWEKNRHWEKQQTWGVQGLQPRKHTRQPAQAVQPRAQSRPQVREAEQPQQTREVQPQRAKRQSKTAEPRHSRPQPAEAQAPQSRPQPAEVQEQPARQHPAEVQQQQAQPQQREAPKKAKAKRGKPAKGDEEEQGKK